MADTPSQQPLYNLGGMNVDVNPFQQKDSDLNLALNFYCHKFGAKKVRFGYAKFLDNPDSSPVRNLFFYQFPNTTGILRVSGKKIYLSTSEAGSWGANIGPTLTDDIKPGMTTITGATNYVVLSDQLDGQYTFDGGSFVRRNGGFTPLSEFLVTYQSRILGDVNQLSLAESFISYDLDLPVAAAGDPFYFDSNSASPAQGGTTSANAGANGRIVGMSVVQNTTILYKQKGITRYDGTNFLDLNFGNSVIQGSNTTSDMFKIDYFMSFNSVYSNDAQNILPISFGVNTIIQDTYANLGIPSALSFCFDYLTFFYLGNIWYQPFQSSPARTFTNAMLVRDERFNEWYIWSVGHNITAFGSYTDSNNTRHMITGDDQGNTYVWGEQYSSDNGKPIDYEIQTKYIDHGDPSGTKVPQPQFAVAADPGSECQVFVAKDFSGIYRPVGTATGYFSKFNTTTSASPSYKTLSIGFKGSTTNTRPEIYGWTLNLDLEERYSDGDTKRMARR